MVKAARLDDDPVLSHTILNKEQRLDLATLIEAYTINEAYLMQQEDITGSIEVGKYADLVMLEKYPEAEIFYEMVGYGVHFKHYLYTVEDTDEKVYLMMTKNTATEEFDNVISCPPNQYHDVGYAVRGSENVVRYLENHDCFSDAAEGYFDYDLPGG